MREKHQADLKALESNYLWKINEMQEKMALLISHNQELSDLNWVLTARVHLQEGNPQGPRGKHTN